MTAKGALTRKAAAEYLSISTRTLDKLVPGWRASQVQAWI